MDSGGIDQSPVESNGVWQTLVDFNQNKGGRVKFLLLDCLD